MALQKIVIEVGGKTDLKSTIDQLQKLGLIDEHNAKQFLKNSKTQQSTIDTTNKKLGLMDKALSNIGPVLAGAFAVNQLVSFGKAIIDTTAKFQKFEAVLVNTLGSKSAAQKALKDIKDFAAKTPFSVAELTESFVKLANQGFKPTQVEMRKLGDLASSTGKSFDQLTEAIIDAQTGEFERLKEFGIRAEKQGDQVKFTFKGVESQVKFTNQSIRDYILSLGDLQGVSGSMSAISKTLGGQISNLGDAFDSLLLAVGSSSSSSASGVIGILNRLITSLTNFISPSKDARQEVVNLQMEFNREIEVLKRANFTQEQRAIAIREINEKYKDYLPALISEKASLKDIEAAQRAVNGAFMDRLILMDFEKEIAELYKLQKQSAESLYAVEKRRTELKINEEGAFSPGQLQAMNDQLNALDSINKKAIDKANKDVENIDKKYQDIANKLGRSWDKIKKTMDDSSKQSTVVISEEYKKAQKAKEEFDKNYHQMNIEFEAKNSDTIKENLKEQHKERVKQMRRTEEEVLNPLIDASKEGEKKITENLIEEEERRKQIRQQAINEGIELLTTALNGYAQLQAEKANIEIDNERKANQDKYNSKVEFLTKQREAGVISEAQFNAKKDVLDKQRAKQESDLKRKQFLADQKANITRVQIETAVSIAKSFAAYGFTPPGFIAAAGAAVQGLLQIAFIKARPVPQFKKGGYTGSGNPNDIAGITHKEEFVVSQEPAKKYRAELEAMQKGTYEKYIMPKVNKKSLSEVRHENMAENIYRSLQLQSQFEDGRIVNAIKDTKRGKKEDAELAKMIASNISDRISEDRLYK